MNMVLVERLIKPPPSPLLSGLLQGDGEETENRGGDRADGGRAAPGGRGEEAPAVRLQVLRAAPPLHHRHPQRPGLLHLLRHPVQPGRGHRGHGQQQHRPPERQNHHQRGVASAQVEDHVVPEVDLSVHLRLLHIWGLFQGRAPDVLGNVASVSVIKAKKIKQINPGISEIS